MSQPPSGLPAGLVKKGRGSHRMVSHFTPPATATPPQPTSSTQDTSSEQPTSSPQPSTETEEAQRYIPTQTAAESHGVVDTLREQLFRRERKLRNLLFVGKRPAPPEVDPKDPTQPKPPRRQLCSVILPYSGPRPANTNKLCLRSWAVVDSSVPPRRKAKPHEAEEGEEGQQQVEEEEDPGEEKSPLDLELEAWVRGGRWFDTYDACFVHLREELASIWALEDVAASSTITIGLQFGTSIVAAKSMHRFSQVDEDDDAEWEAEGEGQGLPRMVALIQSGTFSQYFIPDAGKYVRVAARGLEVDKPQVRGPRRTQPSNVEWRAQLTVFDKDKMSYVTANAVFKKPDISVTTSAANPDGSFRKAQRAHGATPQWILTSLTSTGVRCVWSLMGLPEGKRQQTAEEEEAAKEQEQGSSNEDGEKQKTGEAADSAEGAESKEGEDGDVDEEKPKRLAFGRRFNHAVPIELAFHCGGKKSVQHCPATPFIQQVLSALNGTTPRWISMTSTAAGVAPPSAAAEEQEKVETGDLMEEWRRFSKEFAAEHPAPSSGEGASADDAETAFPKTVEDGNYVLTKLRMEAVKTETIRGLQLERALTLTYDFNQAGAGVDDTPILEHRNVLVANELRVKWPIKAYSSNEVNLDPLMEAASLCRHLVEEANAERGEEAAQRRKKFFPGDAQEEEGQQLVVETTDGDAAKE